MKGLPSRQTVSPKEKPKYNVDEIKEASSRAYGLIVQHYSLLIDAVKKDKSLTDEQKTAAIYSLNLQRRTHATEARRKTLIEERERLKPSKPQGLKNAPKEPTPH